jgi:maltokinase
MDQETLVPEELPPALVELIGPYLARQRWFGGGDGAPGPVRAIESGCLAELGGPLRRLLWAVIEAQGAYFQLVIAERPVDEVAEHLKGHEDALIGNVGDSAYYDATIDTEMALALLRTASGGRESAERSRPLSAEQSNTSLVYDDRLILKFFRRLTVGPNPDVEVTSALASTGFSHVALPLVRWQHNGRDLAFGQQYLAGGTDGWALALTSLRDFYGACGPGGEANPALSGGDFAAEAARLGQMTADMHLAMAEAFGMAPGGLSSGWTSFVASLESRISELGAELAGPAGPMLARLRAVRDPGPAVRAHGDYHLGQVMRTDSGWYVLDFEGEPSRPLDERQRPTSALKDVAGMLRSFQYATRFTLGEKTVSYPAPLGPLARAWEDRNRAAFVRGYYEREGIEGLLPAAPDDRDAVRLAFEVDKALYELAYEAAYRPDWVPIPLSALQRLLSGPVDELLAGQRGF